MLAEALFVEAKRLMTEGRFPEACPKLDESQRLDPSGGTALLLALCLERQGKVASAWAAFSTALALAVRDRNAEREAIAREHLASLEPRLSYLTVLVPAGLAERPGLRVLLDGVALEAPAWGVALPVDVGEHTVRVEVPGQGPVVHRARLLLERQRQVVSLSAAPPAASSSPPARPAARPAARSVVAPVLLAGVGAAAVVSSGILLLSARRDVAQVEALCPLSRCPDPRARERNDVARAKADAAAVAGGLGGALLVGAAALWLWPRGDSPGPALSVGPGQAAIGWRGAW